MLVTLSGIVTLVRDVQSSKAKTPMLITLSGIVTLVRDVQLEKACCPMLVTPSAITADFTRLLLPYHGALGKP